MLNLIGIFGVLSFLWSYAKHINRHSKYQSYSWYRAEHFDVSIAFLRHHIQELYTFKNVVFGLPCTLVLYCTRARHTDTLRPSLAAISQTYRFQAGHARLPIAARCGARVSFRLHTACRRFISSLFPVVVILAASDPTYTAFHCWWLYVSGAWQPPLKRSAVRRQSHQLQRSLFSTNACLFYHPRNCVVIVSVECLCLCVRPLVRSRMSVIR